MDPLFSQPDADHRPAAYWFWHRLPTPAEVVEQVGQMHEAGIHSFQVQARLAYPIEDYLSPGYLAMCRLAVEQAAAKSMTVGIYDEYNWQSGQAGGRTVHGADHLREAHVFWSVARGGGKTAVARVDGIKSSAASLGSAGMTWQYDGAKMEWADWQVLAVVACPPEGAGSMDDVIDLTASAEMVACSPEGCTVETAMPAGCEGLDVFSFVVGRCATSRVPNYLLKQTAERFIEVGYQPFFDSFGEHFGSTVKYLFFDQPHATFYDWAQRQGNLRSSLPYSPELGAKVAAATGQPLGKALLCLLTEVDGATAATRMAFYQTYTDLVLENYLGVLSAWAGDHSIALSGHEVLGHVGSWHPTAAFGSWDLRVNFGLDYFKVDSYRGITGVDAQDCVPQLSTKMGDSVARSNGRSGCIVEQYIAGKTAGKGAYAGLWGLTLEDLRAQAFRLQLLGARQFLYHGFYQTDGYDNDPSFFTNPRFDFPPGINYEPWWPFYRRFANEAARLSVFLDGAEPACEVAVLYPRRTAWMEGPGHSFGDHIEFWARYLAAKGLGYHFIDERDLLRAAFGAKGLLIGNRAYKCLVLPSVTSLGSLESLAALEQFVAAGGLLVASGETPQHLQDGNVGEAAQVWSKLAAADGTVVRPGPPPSEEEADGWLVPLLQYRPHAVPQGGAGIWQWCGTDAQGWRTVLFNDTQAAVEVKIELPFAAAAVTRWEPGTGGQGPWCTAPEHDNGPIFALAPMELNCLRLRPLKEGENLPPYRPGPRVAAGRGAADETVLDEGWTLVLAGAPAPPVAVDVSKGWEQQGFPEYSGIGTYTRDIELPPGDEDLILHLPVVNTAVVVTLNGRVVGSRAWSPHTFVLPRAQVLKGANSLSLTVFSAAANHYYGGTPYQDGPEPSGLGAAPLLLGPHEN